VANSLNHRSIHPSEFRRGITVATVGSGIGFLLAFTGLTTYSSVTDDFFIEDACDVCRFSSPLWLRRVFFRRLLRRRHVEAAAADRDSFSLLTVLS